MTNVVAVSSTHAAAVGTKTADGLLSISIRDAVFLGLEDNRALRVERLIPAVQKTLEEQQAAAFDPSFNARIYGGDEESRSAQGGTIVSNRDSTVVSGQLSIEATLPTGTRLTVEGDLSEQDSDSMHEPFGAARAGISLTQSLLLDNRPAVRLVGLR